MKKIKELMPPENLFCIFEKRIQLLEKILLQKNKSLGNVPEGKVRVTLCHNTRQFYWVKENKNGTYIPQSQQDFARQLAQKEYDEDAVAAIKEELSLLETYLKKTRFSCNGSLKSKLPQRKLDLVSQLSLNDEEYAKLWLKIPYETKGFKKDQKFFTTSKGLKVRSKSEVIIAEILDKNNVSFRYEQKLILTGFNVHPDFTCLNTSDRKEIVWEHFGMMDNPGYAKKACEKLHFYQKSGFFPGKNLIITMETQEIPLSADSVQKIVNQYFK